LLSVVVTFSLLLLIKITYVSNILACVHLICLSVVLIVNKDR